MSYRHRSALCSLIACYGILRDGTGYGHWADRETLVYLSSTRSTGSAHRVLDAHSALCERPSTNPPSSSRVLVRRSMMPDTGMHDAFASSNYYCCTRTSTHITRHKFRVPCEAPLTLHLTQPFRLPPVLYICDTSVLVYICDDTAVHT